MRLAKPMPHAVERFLIAQYKNDRVARLRGLFTLAQSVTVGCIVELGVWHGRGLLALAFGAAFGRQPPVYGVDRFTDGVVDGRRYGPEDEDVCSARLAAARQFAGQLGRPLDVQVLVGDASDVARGWSVPVGLIHWDAGGALEEHFESWSPHLVSGGGFAIHDTADRRLGSDKVIAAALERAYQLVVEDEESSLYVVRKG